MKAFLTISVCWIAVASLGYAETGVVKVDKLNVRAQAKANAETITQLIKGDRLNILEKKTVPHGQRTMNWLKVALPDKATVWITGKFVKDGVVNGEKVNVRSGAGVNFSIVGQAHQGDKVQVVRTLADWDEIRPLPGCFGWVSSDYVELTPELQPAPPAETIQSAPQPPPAAPAIEPASPIVSPAVKPVTDITTIQPSVPPTPSAGTAVPASADVIASTGKPVTLDGVLHSCQGMIIKRPGTHSLWLEGVSDPHIIAYLKSPSISLDQFEGRKVQVTGVETILENWKNPVVEVQKVQPTW